MQYSSEFTRSGRAFLISLLTFQIFRCEDTNDHHLESFHEEEHERMDNNQNLTTQAFRTLSPGSTPTTRSQLQTPCSGISDPWKIYVHTRSLHMSAVPLSAQSKIFYHTFVLASMNILMANLWLPNCRGVPFFMDLFRHHEIY